MKFSKIRDVKSPSRGTEKAAGIDFYIPNDFQSLTIWPREDVLIPSGIKANIPEGFMLMAANKSGVVTSAEACKKIGRKPKSEAFHSSAIVGASIVDEDYQGEIHIHLINTGKEIIHLKPGMKIAQFILVPVNYEKLEEVAESELFKQSSKRGDGGFGSTGAF